NFRWSGDRRRQSGCPILPRTLRKGGSSIRNVRRSLRTRSYHIQRRVHLVPQPLVIRPQRQRIPILLRRRGIHQFVLPTFVVGVFLQHPRLHPPAAIGEHDPVVVIFNHSLRLARSL